jgi:nitrile hydratase
MTKIELIAVPSFDNGRVRMRLCLETALLRKDDGFAAGSEASKTTGLQVALIRRKRPGAVREARSRPMTLSATAAEHHRGGSAMPDDHAHDHMPGSELSEMEVRVRALETILTEKGYIDPAALDRIVEAFETRIGPHSGARIVARAWADPDFKKRLLEDATAAANALGHVSPVGSHLIAVENTPATHNLVVCTLCSCYPWEVLGLPPVWYKSAPYRSRAVIDPKGVLADFGVTLPSDTGIRIWDSTAETRFLVVPMRPAGTEGWSEERLADLVTRDSMVGAGLARRAEEASA